MPADLQVPERARLRWPACSTLVIQFACKRKFWNSSVGPPPLKGHAEGADRAARRYVYSGRVAGAAFAKLRARAQTITRVVLIGPAHYVHVGGIAVSSVDAFETPLGRVPVDTEACSQIGRFEFVTQTDAPHEPEHALEVELPFLQTVLSSFQLVPLVVGDAAPQDVAHLLRQLWDGPETLIVVSSDLSHYHSYETAQRLDLSTAEAIEQGEWASLGPSRACGWVAVAGLLIETERRGLAVTARVVQFRRHGGRARPRRRIRSMDVR